MDPLFEKLASYMGGQITGDQLKLITCILSTYPSALLYRRLPPDQPMIKHLFSIAFTVISMVGVLRLYEGFLHITMTCLVTYLFMKYYDGKNAPWINFVLVMTSMAACHIDRQMKGVEGDGELDYSGALMIVSIKLSSFGFNIRDGRMGAVTDYNKRMQIKQYPSWIEYFGWIFFFGGFLTGPTCEYMDYIRYTHYFFLSKDAHLSPWPATMRVLAKSLVIILFLTMVAPSYSFVLALEPSFAAQSFLKRLWFVFVGATSTRCKYYCVWSLSEGSCILSGFGYNGMDTKTGQHRWDRLSNYNLRYCELADSYKSLTNNWNIGANHWLKHYVYVRLVPPNTKPTTLATIITYVVSSVWHGFHPGYYLLFISTGLYQMLGRRIRRCVRPLVMTPDGKDPLPMLKPVYDVLGIICTMGTVDFLVPPFDLLYWSRTCQVWRALNFFHVWVYVVGWALVLMAEPILLARQKARQPKVVPQQHKQ